MVLLIGTLIFQRSLAQEQVYGHLATNLTASRLQTTQVEVRRFMANVTPL